MYERNAIVLERYFDDLFGNNEKSNLKDNFIKYCNLVECSAKYKEATDSEDKIMQEYDDEANRIKNIQKNQEILSNDSVKFQEERNIIFQNIAEEPENIRKMFEELDKKIDQNNEKIKQNEQDFIRVISNFMEKSDVRNTLGKERKKVESDYSNALNETLATHKNINKEKLQVSREFGENINEYEKNLLDKIKKNGESEVVPFDNSAVKNAVRLEINIQKKVIDILSNAYDKTSRLFLEIKNNNTKIDRHRKFIQDSKVKLDFLDVLKEYLISFLDNERLIAVSGEIEHRKQMREACKNFDDDLIQINNMYELLLKEISSKANKKLYKELYNPKYLYDLEKLADKFEKEVSKLNLVGTFINPNHWRIEGMKKIYGVFQKNVTEIYGRDLSDFEIKENNDEDKPKNEVIREEPINKEENSEVKDIFKNIDNYILEEDFGNKKDSKEDSDDIEDEFDERIDMILGFDKKEDNTSNEEEGTQDNESEQEDIANISDEDFWKEDNESEILYKWDDEEDNEDEDFDDWEDNDNFEKDEYDDDQDDENEGIFNEETFEDGQYEQKVQSGLYEDSYDYGDYDDYEDDDEDFFNEYKEDNSWNQEDEFLDKKKKGKKDVKNSKSDSDKNKKTKGKHDKKDNKPRGLLGKLRK